MKFSKMHGIGNDFIIIEDMKEKIDLTPNQIIQLCDRHFGIGADGLMLVRPSKSYDVKMIFYNQDGTKAAMCGNGVRCFAKYVYTKEIVNKEQFDIETSAGKISPQIIGDRIRVNMGKAEFHPRKIPVDMKKDKIIEEKLKINQKEIVFSSVLVGVPHTIIEMDNLDSFLVKKLGPMIEKHNLFPKGTNVNFTEVLNSEEVKMVTWERGAGLTLACGTGACAVASILKEKGKIQNKVLIHLPGGDLQINFIDENIYMTGPAQEVFVGNINIR